MRPRPWHPPVEPSPAEQAILQRIKRAKLFVFLRRHRHQLFPAAFQDELASFYADSPLGQPPVPPPFSKGTLVAFRRWLIRHDLDRRLLERTIEVAAHTGGFSPRALREAL